MRTISFAFSLSMPSLILMRMREPPLPVASGFCGSRCLRLTLRLMSFSCSTPIAAFARSSLDLRTRMPRRVALPGIADTDLDGFLRRMKNDADSLYWLGLVVGAVVFALSPLLTVYVPLPAFFLPRRLLERHCDRILSSPIYVLRQAVFLVRLSAGMCWGADEKV